MTEKLISFNSWGTVSVDGQFITVILTALTAENKPLTRTLKRESAHKLGFKGMAIIAAEITHTDYLLGSHELGETHVIGHPDVMKVLQDAVGWIRKSAGI